MLTATPQSHRDPDGSDMRKFRDNRDWRRVGDKLGKMLVNCIKNK
jgi:hypothetical protein